MKHKLNEKDEKKGGKDSHMHNKKMHGDHLKETKKNPQKPHHSKKEK